MVLLRSLLRPVAMCKLVTVLGKPAITIIRLIFVVKSMVILMIIMSIMIVLSIFKSGTLRA